VTETSRERILVVDDDERNRLLVRAALGRYDVVEAADGAAALEADERTGIDLVVLDVMMPAMSGFDVCRELRRRHEGRPFLPILLLTALNEQGERNEGLRAGADDFLSKPVDRVELALRVEAFLRTRRQDVLIRRQLDELNHLAALKDDLVSLVAHDLRSPLTAVLSILHVVREEAADSAVKDDLDAAVAAAERVRQTAEDLLEVRLLEEDRLRASRTVTSLAALAGEAARALHGAARARRITVRVEGDATAAVDVKLLRRALENLLANAIRYGPEGEPVEVAIRRDGGAVEIDVADRGPGVPSVARGALFEKFGGVGTRRADARRGYGLGLYLVRLVADAHGGATAVLDREGGGAVFRLRLAEDAGA
jgi:signal transduction histidine kinase